MNRLNRISGKGAAVMIDLCGLGPSHVLYRTRLTRSFFGSVISVRVKRPIDRTTRHKLISHALFRAALSHHSRVYTTVKGPWTVH